MKNPYSPLSFHALILSLSLAGCASTQRSGIDPAQAVGPTTAASKQVLETLEIRAVDLAYQPSALTVAKPGRYVVKLLNTGQMPHNISFPDGVTISAGAGSIAVGEVEVPQDGIGFICSVPGHFHAGMKGEIAVAGRGLVKVTGSATATVVEPDPKAQPYKLYDARAPEPLHDSKVHDIDLVIEEKPMTVAPGYVQKVWAFGGKVPGPVIRVKQGDTVRVHLKNPPSNEFAHSIDFHASQAAWNDEMTSIEPGKEKLYEWQADYAGVWMYHCGSPHPLHHMANGLYGMVIVEPKGGFKEVDHEFALVQSEWYLGAQGQPADLSKALNAAYPDHVVFNGVANQYKDHPLQVDTGKRVRMFVLNVGPSKDSSFHIDGKPLWMPTMVLAQRIASQLSSDGAIKPVVSERYYKLPLANEARTAHLENWRYRIRRWYNQATASIDYSQFGADPVDAVLELGLGGYSVWEEQVELEVLMKLVDPYTKRVLGRTRSETYRALGHAQALLSGDGEKFKEFVTETGTELTANGLRYFGFLSE